MLVTSVLLEDVVVQLDELRIHSVNDAMCRSRDGAHDFVDQLRMPVDYFLEIIAPQTKHMTGAKGSQTHRVLMTVDEAQFAGQVPFSQHRKSSHISATRAVDDLQLALQQHVQRIVAGVLNDQKLIALQFRVAS